MEILALPQRKVRWSICLLFIFVASGSGKLLMGLAPAFSTPLKQKPQYFYGWLWAAESKHLSHCSPQRCFSLGYRSIWNGCAVNSRAATQSQKWPTIFLPRPLTLRLLRASELLCDTWRNLGFPSAVRKTAEANGHAGGRAHWDTRSKLACWYLSSNRFGRKKILCSR